MGNEEWVIALYGRRPVSRKRGAPFSHRPSCLAQSSTIIPRPDEISGRMAAAANGYCGIMEDSDNTQTVARPKNGPWQTVTIWTGRPAPVLKPITLDRSEP